MYFEIIGEIENSELSPWVNPYETSSTSTSRMVPGVGESSKGLPQCVSLMVELRGLKSMGTGRMALGRGR